MAGLLGGLAHAATGCSLRDPGADIRRFFPDATDYVVHYVTFARQDPDALPALGAALGGALDPTFETADVPYTRYTVRQSGRTLGYVFGTNQRGRYSNIQVIAVTGTDHDLRSVYLQTLRSPQYAQLQDPGFLDALASWPIDRYRTLTACWTDGACDGAPAPDPTGGQDAEDYRAILRALAKLSLLREHLLRPGAPRPAPDRAALAEWIGNHEEVAPPAALDTPPRFGALSREALDPGEPVVVVRFRGLPVVLPVARLRARPVVTLPGLVVAWSEPSGTALAIATDRPLRPTTDVLFALRVLRDAETGESWAGPRSVTGDRAGRAVPALVVPAAVAVAALPEASVLVGPEAPAAGLAVTGPRALLVDDRVVPRDAGSDAGVVVSGDLAWALSPVVDGLPRRLRRDGDALVDPDTGTRWDLLGQGRSGPLSDHALGWPVQADLPAASARALSPVLFH